MKRAFHHLVPFTVAAALLVVTGCSSTRVQTERNVAMRPFPPTDPANVRIIRQAPTQPHIRLGEIAVEPKSTSTSVADIDTDFRKAAAKLGADAVVIVEDRTGTPGATVASGWYGSQLSPPAGAVVIGVPIRYLERSPVGASEAP